MPRREPVIDREPGEARLRQRLEQRRDERMLVSLREPTAMHQNARRKRPFALRHPRIQRQRHIAALAALPEEQRSAVHLHVWEDMTFREIGGLLGLPTQTIASRYRYALEKLRTQKHTLA